MASMFDENHIRALKEAGYSKAEAQKIIAVLDKVSADIKYAEAVFQDIIDICHKATGGNASFEEPYGKDTMNQIRVALGLGWRN